jgi:hypothetical protein
VAEHARGAGFCVPTNADDVSNARNCVGRIIFVILSADGVQPSTHVWRTRTEMCLTFWGDGRCRSRSRQFGVAVYGGATGRIRPTDNPVSAGASARGT